MPEIEAITAGLQGMYRDVVYDASGAVTWDSDWRKNTIVDDCRALLAGFMHGAPTTTLGIQGLQVGAGLASWDVSGAPVPPPTTKALVDPNPFTVPRASLAFGYLIGAAPSPTPTNKLEIVATLGPNVPTWPDGTHATGTLREFGLVGDLDGTVVLINCVRHPAITKDPTSTLVRTIWLVF